jgi:hypothetical protein
MNGQQHNNHSKGTATTSNRPGSGNGANHPTSNGANLSSSNTPGTSTTTSEMNATLNERLGKLMPVELFGEKRNLLLIRNKE